MAFVKAQLEVLQQIAATGLPLVGGSISAFVWNTSTPTPMYTDSAGGGSATSFTLNSLGMPQSAGGTAVDIFLNSAIVYKFIIYNAAGGPVGPTIGPVYAGNESNSTVITTGTTAARLLADRFVDIISIKDDSAVVGDFDENTLIGTDNAAGIQRIIDLVDANAGNNGYNNGAVFINQGAFKIATALSVPYGMSMYGTGGTSSVIYCAACNGINFTTTTSTIGSMFFEDFGLTAVSGTNFAAVARATSVQTIDGMYFNRMRFYNWNEGVLLQSTWNSTIENCVFEKVNSPIPLSGGNGVCLGIRIINNRMTLAGGGLGGADRYAIDLKTTTQFTESVHIAHNQIFGFTRAVNAAQCLYLTVFDNDISATGTAISIVTAAGIYNITHNYIEVTANGGKCVYGSGLGADDGNVITNCSYNYMLSADAAYTTTVGIQLNDAGNTNQFNWTIENNHFHNFTDYDIRLNNPGRTNVIRNRCMSTTSTNSIYVGTVSAAPILLSHNWCYKAIAIGTAADLTTGKILTEYNTENNTYFPVTGTFALTDASGGGLTLTTTTGRYTISEPERICRCEIDVTYPATANGSNSRLGGFPKSSISAAAIATVGYRTEATIGYLQMASSAAEGYLETTTGTPITNATMSTDRFMATLTYRY